MPMMVTRTIEPMLRVLKAYWIGWSLLVAGLVSWSAAAVYFEYTNHDFIISTLIQVAGVLLALALAYFFFEHRAQVRQKKIALNVDRTVAHLRSLAQGAVTTAVKQWQDHPYRRNRFDPHDIARSFEEARQFVFSRSRLIEDYDSGIDSFDSLYWVFRNFEELTSYCAQSFRTIGPALMESGALIRAMVNLEAIVNSEKRVWEEFRNLKSDSPLPWEASYNLLVIAELAIRLADVLDSKDLRGDSEYENARRFAPETVWRSREWGEWRM